MVDGQRSEVLSPRSWWAGGSSSAIEESALLSNSKLGGMV